jgi:hypothetical protein
MAKNFGRRWIPGIEMKKVVRNKGGCKRNEEGCKRMKKVVKSKGGCKRIKKVAKNKEGCKRMRRFLFDKRHADTNFFLGRATYAQDVFNGMSVL